MTTSDTLAALVGLDGRPPTPGRCAAWMASAERWCDRTPTEGHLCARHHRVALRRHEAAVAEADRRAERRDARRPRLTAELQRVDARIRQLDPEWEHTDLAAYGGSVHAQITRKRARFATDARLAEMAELQQLRRQLVRELGSVS